MAYTPVGITAGTSSFDLAPESRLDPELFVGDQLRSDVRITLISILRNYLSSKYMGNEHWLRAWIAGSGVSYRWSAAHDLKDLDVLLGINFVPFRSANPGFAQLSNAEISAHVNEGLRNELWPYTSSWRGFEVTWYVNPTSWDIMSIKPYAAYDLLSDSWTVPPTTASPRIDPNWELEASMYHQRATTAVERYSQSLTDMQGATNPAARVDAERRFRMAVEQSVNLFDTVHAGRKTAFSPIGEGYDDWGNYLWQTGKKAGWIQALRQIKDYHDRATEAGDVQTYGMSLPSADTLIRRAALQHR